MTSSERSFDTSAPQHIEGHLIGTDASGARNIMLVRRHDTPGQPAPLTDATEGGAPRPAVQWSVPEGTALLGEQPMQAFQHSIRGTVDVDTGRLPAVEVYRRRTGEGHDDHNAGGITRGYMAGLPYVPRPEVSSTEIRQAAWFPLRSSDIRDIEAQTGGPLAARQSEGLRETLGHLAALDKTTADATRYFKKREYGQARLLWMEAALMAADPVEKSTAYLRAAESSERFGLMGHAQDEAADAYRLMQAAQSALPDATEYLRLPHARSASALARLAVRSLIRQELEGGLDPYEAMRQAGHAPFAPGVTGSVLDLTEEAVALIHKTRPEYVRDTSARAITRTYVRLAAQAAIIHSLYGKAATGHNYIREAHSTARQLGPFTTAHFVVSGAREINHQVLSDAKPHQRRKALAAALDSIFTAL